MTFAELLLAEQRPTWLDTDGNRADDADDLVEALTGTVAAAGEPVAIPIGTTGVSSGLAAAVRRSGAVPVGVAVGTDGVFRVPDRVRIVWWQATDGTVAAPPADGRVHLVDGRDSCFAAGRPPTGGFRAVIARPRRDDDLGRRQSALCAELDRAVREAAGLATVTGVPAGLVPHGAVVLLPDGCDDEAFVAIAASEGVPLSWRRDPARIVIPAGPHFRDEEVTHGALAVVKAAEHTGWRWFCEPDRARWYRDLLDEWYGPGHDAYRPVFPV